MGISNNNSTKDVDITHYKSVRRVSCMHYYKKFNWFLRIGFGLLILILFLPWTQNIKGKGFLTTLRPEQRPQKIQSAIAGRVEKWFVKEGDFIKKGDTLLEISEIKSDYFDAQIANRAKDQMGFKQNSVLNYTDKIKALTAQIKALQTERLLKNKQAKNKLLQANIKVARDSLSFKIAQRQYKRVQTLYQEGLKALKEVETKNIKK